MAEDLEFRALEMLNTPFSNPLAGDEDAQARARWGNIMNARLKIWPYDKLDVAPLLDAALKGRAWNEYRSMEKRQLESEKDFAKRVVEHFSKAPQAKPTDLNRFMAGLKGRKIRPGESLDDAFFNLEKEIAKFNWTEKKAVDSLLTATFVGMLPSEVQLILAARDTLTPQEALEVAKRTMSQKEENDSSPFNVLSQLKEMYAGQLASTPIQGAAAMPQQQATPSQDVKSIVDQAMSGHLEKVDALTEGMKELQKTLQSLSTNGNNKKPKNNNIQQNNAPKVPCQICGGKNHRADTCWYRGTGSGPPARRAPAAPEQQVAIQNTCQLCGGHDHVARDCNRRRLPKCFRCGQTGHIERFCTYGQQQYRPNSNRYYNQPYQYQQYQAPQQQGAPLFALPPPPNVARGPENR